MNTVHSSFITLGVIVGSSGGGLAINSYGLRAPLWLGAGLAVLGILTLLPDLRRRSGAVPAVAPERPGPEPYVLRTDAAGEPEGACLARP